MERLLSCKEVADRHGVKIRTVWKWIRSGKLRAIQTGKIYRVDPDDLAAFEAARETKPA